MRKGLPLNVGIRSLGRCKWHHHSTLMKHPYLTHSIFLDVMYLLDLAKGCTYNQEQKYEKSKKRHIPTVVHVWPLFTKIPNKNSNAFVELCWSEILLYKPLCSFSKGIDLSKKRNFSKLGEHKKLILLVAKFSYLFTRLFIPFLYSFHVLVGRFVF